MAANEEKGLLCQDNTGNVYYFRPEILKACMVQPEEVEDVKKGIEQEYGETSGFGFTALSGISTTGSLSGVTSLNVMGTLSAVNQSQLPNLGKVASTVMCPW